MTTNRPNLTNHYKNIENHPLCAAYSTSIRSNMSYKFFISELLSPCPTSYNSLTA